MLPARLLPALVLLLPLVLVGALAGCPPAATLPAGCGKDTDCKGVRICVAHACVDPPPRARPAVALAPDAGPPDGGAPADAGPTPGDAGAAAAPPIGASAMFHVDATHSGRSRFRAPTTTPSETMHVATGGVVVSSPAITSDGDDGIIVFGSHDKSIYGADAGGKILWRRPTSDLVWGSPALGPGGVAYVGSDDDHLYALDVKDGSLRWSFQAGPCRVNTGVGPEGARCDVDGVTVGPDGTVYVAADGVYALNPADGKPRWKFAPGVTHCASQPAVGPDGTIYVGCRDDGVYALTPEGQKRWDFRTGDDVDSSPAVAPDGTVYIGSDDRKLYAFNPGGGVRWALTTGGPVRSSPALAADGTVYVGSFDGALYAVRPNGAVAWSFRTADRIAASPVVDAAGNILIGSEDDRLYALAPDGKLLWSILLDGDVDSTPALGPDGTIYIGCDDRALHGLH